MIHKASVCILFIIWACFVYRVEGNEFKLEYDIPSPDTIDLNVQYDSFRIHYIFMMDQYYYIGDQVVYRIRKLQPCSTYQFVLKVINLKTNQEFDHVENILLIPSKLIHKVVPDSNSIYIEVNFNYIKCFDSVTIIVNNTREIVKTQSDLSSWLTILDLSACINHKIVMYINHDGQQHKIYNNTIKTISIGFRQVKTINFDSATSMLTWPNFLGDCSFHKYLINITQTNDATISLPIVIESVMNEYHLDFLDGCSKYQISVTSKEHLDTSKHIAIYSGYKDPSPITDLNVSLINNTLLITWSPPINNSACIKAPGYKIYVDDASVHTMALEHTLIDYKPCKVYKISVCHDATNRKKCVNSTFQSSTIEDTKVFNVSKIDVTTNGPNKLTTVAWNVSKHYEYCVNYYNVRLYEEESGLNISERRVNVATVVLSRLIACQKYRLHLETFLVQHPSSIESSIEFTISPPWPDAPRPPELIARTSSSLTLKTVYDSTQFDKCKIEIFLISCVRGTRNRFLNDEIGNGTINNLGSSLTYRCSAKAKNHVGWSSASETCDYKTESRDNDAFGIYLNSVLFNSIELVIKTSITATCLVLITEVESIRKFPKNCEYLKYNKSIPEDIRAGLNIIIIDSLRPNTNYSLQVECYSSWVNNSHQMFVTTEPDVAFQVTNLKISSSNQRSVTITWQLPCTLNGQIRNFVGSLIGIDRYSLQTTVYNWSVAFGDDMYDYESFNYTETRIKPDHNYTIIVAIKLANFAGPLNESNIKFYSSIDPTEINQNTVWSLLKEELSDGLEIQISLPIEHKIEEFKLLITDIACFVDHKVESDTKELVNPNRCTRECLFDVLPKFVKINLRDEIAPDCHIIDHNNIELKTETGYTFEGLYVTSTRDWYNTHPIHFKPQLKTNSSSVRTVAIILLVLVIFLILVGIGWYSYHKCQSNKTSPRGSTYFEVDNFYDFYKLLTIDNYINEYKTIENMDLSDLDITISKNQPGKNRYNYNIPYDYNRVVLVPNEFCATDYINASHIDGYKCKNRYIATQGPTENTVYDFWHMVITKKCNKVVMLTQLEEAGFCKCFKYFPQQNETLNFNDLTITNVGETNFGYFIQRCLVVSKGQTKRFVTQYQYLKWLTRDCPTNEHDLINFIEYTKSVNNKSTKPMIVHCSAGVGRTGTFIALDVLIHSFQKEKYISIMNTVRQLRRQRCRMVQTIEQFEFLYTTINMYYLKW